MPFCLEQARIKPRIHRQIIALDIRTITGGAGARAERGDMELLKRSIARIGLISPLLVRARGEGYELIAGARRLSACRALGMKRVECIVMPALEEEAILAALGENACRAQPLAQDTAQARDALIARHGYLGEELDAILGAAEQDKNASLSRADNTQAAPPDIKQAMPHRRARGYIRDERLIVNALDDVVNKLRGAGVKAHIDVERMDDSLCVRVVFPDAHAENHTKNTCPKGEHSVEFCDFAGKNHHESHMKIEKQNEHVCEHQLGISDAGREIAGMRAAKNAFDSETDARILSRARANMPEKSADGPRMDAQKKRAAAPTEEYFMQMLRDEMKRGIPAASRA